MNEETIYDQKEVDEEKQGKDALDQEKTGFKAHQEPTRNEVSSKDRERTFKTAGIAGVAGVAGAAIGILTPVNVFPDVPDDGNEIEEISEPEAAPSTSGHLQGHDMDVATGVDDSMSFNQAFAAARHEVGPGGLFVWQGHTYGTYYANEWNAMSPEEHDQYWADVTHTTENISNEFNGNNEQPADTNEPIAPTDPLANGEPTDPTEPTEPIEPVESTDPLANGEPTDPTEPIEPIEPVEPADPLANGEPIDPTEPTEPIEPVEPTEPWANVEPVDPTEPIEPIEPIDPNEPLATVDPEPLELAEEDVIVEFDLDGDGNADTGFVDANDNEILDVVLDTTGDGSYDTLVIDPEVDEDGNLVVAEDNIKEIGGVEINVPDVDDNIVFDGGETGDDDLFTDETVDDNFIAENPDVDDFASYEPDSNITIHNNMDMSDFV